MADHRVSDVDEFTETRHSCVQPSLRPERVSLPDGFTVCVIGASYGIGEHVAYAFAKAGVSNLCLAARGGLSEVADRVRSAAKRKDLQVEVCKCDVGDEASVRSLSEFVAKQFGRCDVVVPNAAYAGRVTLKMTEGESDWVERAIQVNAMGTYYVARHFVPLLLGSEGGAKLFLPIGSVAACIRRGSIANMGYCVSKMAQARMVEYLSEQYGEKRLLALSVHPGAVATPMAMGPDGAPEEFRQYLKDDVDLCGAVCVWISRQVDELRWLNGRMICATWDMEELVRRREEVEKGDKLKFAMVV